MKKLVAIGLSMMLGMAVACTGGGADGTFRDGGLQDSSIAPESQPSDAGPASDVTDTDAHSDGGETAQVGPPTIGPAGGEVTATSGARILVPAGAVGEDAAITAMPFAAPIDAVVGGHALGPGLAAGPEGQTFSKLVTVTLPFDPNALPVGADPTKIVVRMAPTGSTAYVTLASTVDLAKHTVSAQTSHFTDFVPVLLPDGGTPLTITTNATLPSGSVGSFYSQLFSASGGSPPYTWSLSAGASVPAGLSVGSGGVLSGTPTLATNGSFFVTVSDSTAMAVQAAFSVTINPASNPVPTVMFFGPQRAMIGSAPLTLTLTGTGFSPSSQVFCDGSTLPMTFVDGAHLLASLSAARLSGPVTYTIWVVNSAPGGGTSNAVSFVVSPKPAFSVASISPNPIPAGGVSTQVTITGTGFSNGDTVTIGNQGISTTFQSGISLRATIPASYLGASGTLLVHVYSPAHGFTDTYAALTVGAPTKLPTISWMGPAFASVGGSSFTLRVRGAGFVDGGHIYFGPTALPTTVESAEWAHATVSPGLLTQPSILPVVFVNPAPSGASSSMAFTIDTRPPNLAWTKVDGNSSGGCGLTDSKQAYCWGASPDDFQAYHYPTLAGGGMTFDTISTSAQSACAIKAGQLYCWGRNDASEALVSSPTPAPVLVGKSFSRVSSGRDVSCALSTTGELYCWGTASPGDASGLVAGTYADVSASQGLVCALSTNGLAHCWGSKASSFGDLTGQTFSSVSADFGGACGLTSGGVAYCWGDNFNCALGVGYNNAIGSPQVKTPTSVVMPDGVSFAAVEFGCFGSCALSTTGDVYCWGAGTVTAAGVTGRTVAPTLISGLPPMSSISQGTPFCGVSSVGERWCWDVMPDFNPPQQVP